MEDVSKSMMSKLAKMLKLKDGSQSDRPTVTYNNVDDDFIEKCATVKLFINSNQFHISTLQPFTNVSLFC